MGRGQAHGTRNSGKSGKRGQQQRKEPRKRDKQVKEKFVEERATKRESEALKPQNPKQAEYMYSIQQKSLVIATGFAGTSKTYIPTVMACDAYRAGDIKQIYITRPATSNSKSLGAFGGDLVEKMSNWLGEVISVLRERLGQGTLELAIKRGEIEFIPFEVIKGRSLKDCFVILDEAEDCTQEEIKKFITRIGTNCTAVMAGDISQSELKERSGLRHVLGMLERNSDLMKTTGVIDFNATDDIVRSDICKDWIIAYNKEESQK